MASYWDEYVWIVAMGGFMAFFMAYGIGANDVANAFATSVGSKALTLFQACVLAGIMEFSGALLLGRGVTSTIKSGIIKIEEFEDIPEIMMYGMLCALTSAGLWLIIATYFELPVSTTHSIIGGIVGFGLVAGGGDAVLWYEEDDQGIRIKGIVAIVISWFMSPILSGIVAAVFFLIARTFVLRAENSYERTYIFFPILVFVCIFINAFYVLDKGVTNQTELALSDSAWISAVIAVACFIVAALGSFYVHQKNKGKAAEEIGSGIPSEEKDGVKGEEVEKKSSSWFGGIVDRVSNAVNSNDIHGVADTDERVRDMHANAEIFDPRTEGAFRYLQVLTSCCDSFAHGANDVANSIGPFSAIWGIYNTGQVASSVDVPIWILVLGGFGIVVGLATYGYKIIRAIGVKMTKITPSRGFAIELGSALIIITGSRLELPLSTTHCQVGATVAVGMVEGQKGVEWNIFIRTCFGWVLTIIVAGFLSAVLMAQGIFAPSLRCTTTVNELHSAIYNVNTAQTNLMASCPAANFQANLNQAVLLTNATTVENTVYPKRASEALEYVSQLYTESTQIACPAEGAFTPLSPELNELTEVFS